MEVKIISDLVAEPITLALAKAWMKVDEAITAEDEIIAMCARAARIYCEKYVGLSFGPKTLEVKLPYYPPQELPYGPNIAVTGVLNAEGMTILSDASLGSTWLAEYLKGMSVNNTYKEDYFSYGSWLYSPLEYLQSFYYTVTYTAGFPSGQLPENIKMAVLKMTADLYENRENTVVGMTVVAELPNGVKRLLDLEKTKVLFA